MCCRSAVRNRDINMRIACRAVDMRKSIKGACPKEEDRNYSSLVEQMGLFWIV